MAAEPSGRSQGNPSPAKHRLFGLITLALIAGLLEGTSAIYLNFLAQDPRSLHDRNVPFHVYDAYRNHALGPGWSSQGRLHNAQGFRRSTDVSKVKPEGTYRIFLMGGSAAYGLSAAAPFPPHVITNEQTIDYKLEHLLQPLFPDLRIEVINAAVTAYWTHHHLIYLHETLLNYDPDLIVFMDGINDYYHTREDHEQFASYRYSMTLKTDSLDNPSIGDVVRDCFGWAKHYSHLAYVMNVALTRLLHWDVAPEDPCQTEVVKLEDLNDAYAERYVEISKRTWVRTLRSILMLLDDQGIKAITSLQPELIFKRSARMSAGDEQLYEIEIGQRPEHYVDKKAFLKPLARSLAAQTATEFGATFVDLTDVFDEKAQYFVDYCHLSEDGSERIAQRLLPYVKATVEQGVRRE